MICLVHWNDCWVWVWLRDPRPSGSIKVDPGLFHLHRNKNEDFSNHGKERFDIPAVVSESGHILEPFPAHPSRV